MFLDVADDEFVDEVPYEIAVRLTARTDAWENEETPAARSPYRRWAPDSTGFRGTRSEGASSLRWERFPIFGWPSSNRMEHRRACTRKKSRTRSHGRERRRPRRRGSAACRFASTVIAFRRFTDVSLVIRSDVGVTRCMASPGFYGSAIPRRSPATRVRSCVPPLAIHGRRRWIAMAAIGKRRFEPGNQCARTLSFIEALQLCHLPPHRG